MATLESKLQALRDGYAAHLVAQGDTALVTREWKNHEQMSRAELIRGRWTLVAGAGQGFDQSRDLDESLRGGQHGVALIFQTIVPERTTTEELEQHVNEAYERMTGYLKSGSCCLYFSGYDRCKQLFHPYGWLAASLYFTE